MSRRRLAWTILAALLAGAPAWAADSLFPFDQPEPVIQASPTADLAAPLPGVTKLLFIDVSPVSSEVAVLVQAEGRRELRIWNMAQGSFTPVPQLPPDALEVAWHPASPRLLFVATANAIVLLDLDGHAPPRTIWSGRALSGLVAGPRPFEMGEGHAVYRVYFTERQADGRSWLRSVGENGAGAFVVAAPGGKPAADHSDGETLPTVDASLGHVAAFHPSGNEMLVRNASGCPTRLDYRPEGWSTQPSGPAAARFDLGPIACTEQLQFSPNGLYLLRWTRGTPGLTVQGRNLGPAQSQRSDLAFIEEPLVTADGRGVVGVTGQPGALMLHYARIALELPDVTDAWMFVRDQADLGHFTRHGGMLRPTSLHQMYGLYDTESFYCGAYSAQTATRPYMVTTDAFWELYASSYEGLFVVVERSRAIPAFRHLVVDGAADLLRRAPNTPAARAFAAAAATLANDRSNPEAARILDATTTARSESLGQDLDYRVYAPRGHYTADDELKHYFAAVRFLGHIRFGAADIATLRAAPPTIAAAAQAWNDAYTAFIAPARGPAIFSNEPPGETATLLPLSFGADNAVFEQTIEHRQASDAPGSFALPLDGRQLPSGLDLAAAFGSGVAWRALDAEGVFERYPALPGRLQSLQRRFHSGGTDNQGIYASWLQGLAVQWADDTATPIAGPLWDAKRLQTGLASWATLRHATVLVNEVEGAECGGPGAERIVMRPPRGMVEPDPATFDAIAGLFAQNEALVHRLFPATDALGQGILRRLAQSRADTRKFAGMARKELAGQPLAPQDYADINFVGQAIEHNFKVFLSLMRKDEALVEPEPIDKIAEVAGDARGWLEAAVGGVLEWDQVAPAFGRHDIFKGAAYSYFEFTAPAPLNDAAWRALSPRPAPPAWIAPFLGAPVPAVAADESGEPLPP